jgi:AmmeMemoRadiSam system protein A
MERLPLCDPALETSDGVRLLDIADEAVRSGLQGLHPVMLDLDQLPDALRTASGVFVTLLVDGELNGCIGSIQGTEPIGHAAARHAWSAAFADPRLPALCTTEYERLTIEVSVLSPLVQIDSGSRRAVLDRLEPGRDGLLLSCGPRRAVFLPSVWEQLGDPVIFVDHLLHKAELRPGSWPHGILAWCFTVEKFSRRTAIRTAPTGTR